MKTRVFLSLLYVLVDIGASALANCLLKTADVDELQPVWTEEYLNTI